MAAKGKTRGRPKRRRPPARKRGRTTGPGRGARLSAHLAPRRAEILGLGLAVLGVLSILGVWLRAGGPFGRLLEDAGLSVRRIVQDGRVATAGVLASHWVSVAASVLGLGDVMTAYARRPVGDSRQRLVFGVLAATSPSPAARDPGERDLVQEIAGLLDLGDEASPVDPEAHAPLRLGSAGAEAGRQDSGESGQEDVSPLRCPHHGAYLAWNQRPSSDPASAIDRWLRRCLS